MHLLHCLWKSVCSSKGYCYHHRTGKKLGCRSAAVGAFLFQSFQHQAIDSCHTILCTKCHISYYKFSAEYSAELMGLRTKREFRQGHLWNATWEFPPSLGCEAGSWPLRLWVWHRWLWRPTIPQKDDCQCCCLNPYNICGIACSYEVSVLSSSRKC